MVGSLTSTMWPLLRIACIVLNKCDVGKGNWNVRVSILRRILQRFSAKSSLVHSFVHAESRNVTELIQRILKLLLAVAVVIAAHSLCWQHAQAACRYHHQSHLSRVFLQALIRVHLRSFAFPPRHRPSIGFFMPCLCHRLQPLLKSQVTVSDQLSALGQNFQLQMNFFVFILRGFIVSLLSLAS